jgi:hypothetical protein
MDALIEALVILRKYANPDRPTECECDVITEETALRVNVSPALVSAGDLARLRELSFEPDRFSFFSAYFGSC